MDSHFSKVMDLLDKAEELRVQKKFAVSMWDEKIKAVNAELQEMRDNRNQLALELGD